MPSKVYLVSDRHSFEDDTDTILLQSCLIEIGVEAEVVVWDDESIVWENCDLCVIRSTWDYITRIEEFITWLDLAGSKTQVWNPVGLIKWNLHKQYLLELQENGVAVIPTEMVRRGSTLSFDEIPMVKSSEEIIIKPCVSINAIGTKRFKVGDAKAPKHYADLLTKGDVLIQPFISEILEQGEISLLFIDRIFSHAVRKIGAKGDFRIHEEYGGRVEVYDPAEEDLELANKALEFVAEEILYVRVDLVLTKKGPRLMELEMIEPSMFLGLFPDKTKGFARVISLKVN